MSVLLLLLLPTACVDGKFKLQQNEAGVIFLAKLNIFPKECFFLQFSLSSLDEKNKLFNFPSNLVLLQFIIMQEPSANHPLHLARRRLLDTTFA